MPMWRSSHPVGRTAYDPRLVVIAALAAVMGLVAVLQRMVPALFPHAVDGFLGGVAVGLGVSAVWGWAMSRA
jgi:NO-binding membrane sensor protein with MHYT domain